MRQKLFCHLKITDINYKELMEKIDIHVKNRKKLSIERLNLKQFVLSIFNKKLRESIRLKDIVLPRGKFMFKMVKKLYPDYGFEPTLSKELVTPLLREYHQFPINFVIFGGSSQGLNRLSVNLKASFPGLNIIGTYPKEFLYRKDDVKTIIKKSEPHFLILGVSDNDPIWVEENSEALKKTITILVQDQVDIMCLEKEDIPYKYKANDKEFSYILKKKPYRILDVFIWAFVWFRYKIFSLKLKKRRKKRVEKSNS